MKAIRLEQHFDEYENMEELPEADRSLMREAERAAEAAYAPYSKFHVGAAVLLNNGVVVRGNNQENAAYPSGLCAERVAVFAAGAHYPNTGIKAIAITAYSELKENHHQAVSPCGDCRQVMAEYEHRYGHSIRLIMEAEDGKYLVSPSVKQLLPYMFNSDNII
jgi:cytidine deaminase